MKAAQAFLSVVVLQSVLVLGLLLFWDSHLECDPRPTGVFFSVWNEQPHVPLLVLPESQGTAKSSRDLAMEEVVAKFSQAFFDKSVSYSGTNHRLRRIIRRALAGESISIAILGGSSDQRPLLASSIERTNERLTNVSLVPLTVTLGKSLPRLMAEHHTYHAVFYQWWQQTFPHANHSYYPTGIGGVGSHYFANCFLEHIPAEVDLVIVDSAVNDQRLDDQHRSFDMLLRSLLTLPSAPAVMSLEFFPISSISPLTTGGTNQLDSSRFLDVPSLSLRNPLLPELLLHPSRIPSFFGRLPMSAGGVVDGRHPDLRGHLAAANILKHHVWQQILFVEAHNTEEDVALEKLAVSRIGIVDEEVEGVYDSERVGTEEENEAWQIDRTFLEEEDWGMRNEELEVVPRMSLLDRFHLSSFIPPSVPRCRSLSGTREKLVLLSTTRGDRVENGTTFPGEGDGWFEWHSPPHKQYIISRSPKARATFNITVGAGDVKIWYLKSSTFGLGSVHCWVDDEEKQAKKLTGLWEYPHNIGMMGIIRTKLSPGDHLLHCELDGNGEFRISTLITG